MNRPADHPALDAFPTIMGPSQLVRRAFEGQDLAPLTQSLIARMNRAPGDAGALMDLATVLLCQGGETAQSGLALMTQALRVQPTYVVRHGDGSGPHILSFVVAGDFMANTPLDFLLVGSDATLILHYVDELPPRPGDLPDHDVAFLAIGESAATSAILNSMGPALAQWPRPVLNNAPGILAALSRDRASQMLAGLPGVLAPPVFTMRPQGLHSLAAGGGDLQDIGADLMWPVLLRPVGSHGGKGLERIGGPMDMVRWLSRTPAQAQQQTYLMPFIDYRGQDGLYSKYRIAMIGGHPFASHMAQSSHWMVHYLNAEMDLHEERRHEEAIWMASFDTVFARKHAKALAAVHQRLGLDYFALDCAEAPDGRLLIFEVDTAMIIHDMDDRTLYPYKAPAMRKLFDGFLAVVERHLPPRPPQKGRRAA